MAQSPDCQAGGPEADRGAGRGRAGKQFLPLLSPVELGGGAERGKIPSKEAPWHSAC